VTRKAARRLKEAYGGRLIDVFFGSWVRGQAHEESDVDLLVVLDQVPDRVVLDQVPDRAKERNRIVDILFDLELESRRAIEGFPVEADWQWSPARMGGRRAAPQRRQRDGASGAAITKRGQHRAVDEFGPEARSQVCDIRPARRRSIRRTRFAQRERHPLS
jgi:predicted nucleotidyltransferase